jgi:hypothetical protein
MVNNSMSIYRKIWQQHHGPIPRDRSGRSLEIHHIDGDHSNNDISNLKLVTIEEHYQIHYDQGDWNACLRMSYRMGISPKEKSDLAKKNALKRIADGTHHWQGPDHNRDLVSRGIHPFLDKEAARQRNLRRIAKGTHNLIGDKNPVHKLIAQGQHHFQTNNPSSRLIKQGTHHFLTNHPNKIQVQCPHCGRIGGSTNMKRYHFDRCKKKIIA